MLCNYKVFGFENALVERFTFRNRDGIELCDAITAIFVDLTQAKEIAKKPVSDMTGIESWAVFFALGNDPEYSGVVDEITKMKEGIAVARDTLLTVSQNADERARFHSRRKWLQDREHEQAVARKEGREEARAEYEPLLASKDAEIAGKDAEIAGKDAEIEALRALLDKQNGQSG